MNKDIPAQERKLVAGLLAIFLGGFGAHKFYLGYTSEAATMLAISLGCIALFFLSCGFLFPMIAGPVVIGIIALIEGIVYLSKSDEDFHQTYIENKKGWF